MSGDGSASFKALLQPLQDLASNWDIDIADSLTEYLEELSSLQISIDGGEINLNFAQAALLIQGSTAVYSLKVEHLYKLVQNSLDFIISSKKRTSVTTNGNKTRQGTSSSQINLTEESIAFGNDPSFLLLDDAIDIGKNIDFNTSASLSKQQAANMSFMSMGAADTSMLSIKSVMNSVLGGNDHAGSFALRLSSCAMDGCGALLIEGISDQQLPDTLNNCSQSKISMNDSSCSIIHPSDGKALLIPLIL